MGAVCIAGGCLDAQAPTRVSLVKLCQWAESDAEFLKLIAVKESPSFHSKSPTWHDSYVCRQRYLRSYTFSKKETVAEKTKKWIKKKKRKNGTRDGYVTTSCFVLGAVFKCLLACVVKIDVVEH